MLDSVRSFAGGLVVAFAIIAIFTIPVKMAYLAIQFLWQLI